MQEGPKNAPFDHQKVKTAIINNPKEPLYGSKCTALVEMLNCLYLCSPEKLSFSHFLGKVHGFGGRALLLEVLQ